MRQNWEHVVGCHVYVGMQVNVQGLRAPDLVVIVLRILHGDLELIATALAPLLYIGAIFIPHIRQLHLCRSSRKRLNSASKNYRHYWRPNRSAKKRSRFWLPNRLRARDVSTYDRLCTIESKPSRRLSSFVMLMQINTSAFEVQVVANNFLLSTSTGSTRRLKALQSAHDEVVQGPGWDDKSWDCQHWRLTVAAQAKCQSNIPSESLKDLLPVDARLCCYGVHIDRTFWKWPEIALRIIKLGSRVSQWARPNAPKFSKKSNVWRLGILLYKLYS